MLKIPAGQFENWYNSFGTRMPVLQTIVLPRPFLICDREVTVAQYRLAVEHSDCPESLRPHLFARPSNDDSKNVEPQIWCGADAMISPTEEHPVQQVSWIEAVMYCNWLSRREGLTLSYEWTGDVWDIPEGKFEEWVLIPGADGYRLPTHAEWEYACRATSITRFCFGDEDRFLSQFVVHSGTHTQVCGSKLPNAWGLFDVHGNVCEWVNDWNSGYRGGSDNPSIDPMGPPGDSLLYKCACSSEFRGTPASSISQYRVGVTQMRRDLNIGFRVARSLTTE